VFGDWLIGGGWLGSHRASQINRQIGGAVKNVIAIAAGMCEGLGLGTNGTYA
jgi:glycerol-3-phosphate dehydrogenase